MGKCRYYKTCEGFKTINFTCSKNDGMYYEDERPCGTYRSHEENNLSYPMRFKIYEFLSEFLSFFILFFGVFFYIFIRTIMFIYSPINSLVSRMRNKNKK